MAAVSCTNRRTLSAVLRVCSTSKPSYTAVVTPAVRTACRSDGAGSTAEAVCLGHPVIDATKTLS